MPHNILIVEDHPLVAEATHSVLASYPNVGDVEICSTAPDAKAALAKDSTRWSLILLDLDVPGAVGLSLASHIKHLGLAPITCILTGTFKEEYVAMARQEGFQGYILKASRTDALVRALRAVLAREQVFPELDETMTGRSVVGLTPKQREVLQLVCRGFTSKEIAREMKLTPGTVDNHANAAIAALGARNRSEAVTRALSLGLIQAEG